MTVPGNKALSHCFRLINMHAEPVHIVFPEYNYSVEFLCKNELFGSCENFLHSVSYFLSNILYRMFQSSGH